MQLTRHTDYGLRTLIYLALRRGERITDSEISGAFEISQNHLQKVVQKLAACGVIDTQRGKNGGITLAKPPESIHIGAVLRDLEEELEMINCSRPLCPAMPACRLKKVLADARDAFLAVLDECTVEDLLNQRQDTLRVLLSRTE